MKVCLGEGDLLLERSPASFLERDPREEGEGDRELFLLPLDELRLCVRCLISTVKTV